nr:extracellular solute-binding protein [Angustibacter aerolatus]
MRTRNLAHMLAPATVLALAACGGVGSGGSGDDDTKASGGKVTITTMGFGTPDEIATSRLKTYESAADGGPVKVTEGGFDQQQFLSAVASGNPPDVVYLSRDDVGTFAASGAIQPMTDCIKSANVDMSQYRAPAVAQVTLASTVYALPEFYGLRLLISDDDVLAKAGVPVSDVATGDWDTIEAANDRLTKGSGRGLDVIGYDPRVPDTLRLWTAANGGEMLSADGRTAKPERPEGRRGPAVHHRPGEARGGTRTSRPTARARTSSARRTSTCRTRSGPCRSTTSTSTCWPTCHRRRRSRCRRSSAATAGR